MRQKTASKGEPNIRRPKRQNNPERSKEDILRVAMDEFARNGLSGARVDQIALRTSTSKRMIYYYFGGKEALYRAVLEKAYSGIRDSESDLALEKLSPIDAIRALVGLTFDYDDKHPEFIKLVTIENLHEAQYLAQAPVMPPANNSAIRRLDEILRRGRKEGLFRSDLDAVDVHMAISALCFFRVANRHTFQTLFKCDLSAPKMRAHHRTMIVETILRLLSP